MVHSTPYVSCEKGFHFLKDDHRMTIKLSGIVFKGTPLEFDDCSKVQLINCSYHNATKAVSVRTETIPTVHLNIQGPSLFQNNIRCVWVSLKNGSGHSLVFNVNQTRFRENGFDKRSVKSLISIATNVKVPPRPLHVQIFFHNVASVKNRAPFLVLDLRTGVTNEEYSNVTLSNNNLKKPSDLAKENRFADSLYISRARKTNARFLNFHCANNSNSLALRCIKVSSNQAKVEIDNSSFVGHVVAKGKGGAVSVECKLPSSLVVKNTAFDRNRANCGGGAIFFNSAKGNLRLNLTNVNFSECEAMVDGSAMLVGKTHTLRAKPIDYSLYAYFTNVRVNNCIGRNSSVCMMIKGGHVTFEQFNWTNTRLDVTGGIFIGRTGEKTDVRISESTFIDSQSNGSVFVRIEALKKYKGSVIVANTSMFNSQEAALLISPKYKITLKNVTMSFCKHGFQISQRWLSQDKTPLNPVKIMIDNCTFRHNFHDLSVTLRDTRSVWFTITNSIFTGQAQKSGYAIRFYIPALKEEKLRSRATIELDRVIFDSRPASSFALYFQGKKCLTIRRSIFRRCTSFLRERWNCGESKSIYETATGAISILSIPDKPHKLGCVQRNVYNNTHPLWKYDSHVTFEDTLFQENAGLIGGAVYISNGNTTFRNCSFKNNFATQKTGQVYSAYGTGRVEFSNCSFVSERNDITIAGKKFGNIAFFYSESGGPVMFRNTSMFSSIAKRRSFFVLEVSSGGYVDFDNKTTIRCKGSQLSLENATHFSFTEKRKRYCLVNVTVLKFSCRLCSPGYYSLQTGYSKGFTVDDSFQCQPCPLGATCIKNNLNIAAKENFWGYQVPEERASKLNFIPCPKNYCQTPSPRSSVSVYNKCYGNRTGFLCGKCMPGYTESLFNAECRKTTRCSDYLVWIAMLVFSAGLALYLLIDPPLLRLLSAEHILWFIKKKENSPRNENCKVHEEQDSGYLKIAFYYYQVADLLLSNSLEDLLPRMPFISAIISAFNFQVRAVYRRIDCPFSGLTPVSKELLLSLVVFATMANVPLIYCAHVVINRLRKGAAKPSIRHYMAVVLEILLLGYDRLAETSLGLMHCVTIGNERRLFIDGNTLCWQAWQYILLGYIVVFVVPFIAVLYYGSSKLHKSSISAGGFLAACVIPLPFLIYWLFKRVCSRREGNIDDEAATRQNDNIEVMKVLHEPFRAPIGQDKGTLYWESVLIGRRLILLTFHSFIPNAMLRFFFMAFACDLMTIHHIVKTPFRNATANKVEALSLVTLAIIAKISLIKATLLSSGISPEGQNKVFLEGLQWFELAAMGIVPALLSLLAVLAILSHIMRLAVYLVKQIMGCVRKNDTNYASLDDWREPLLYGQELNFEDSS